MNETQRLSNFYASFNRVLCCGRAWEWAASCLDGVVIMSEFDKWFKKEFKDLHESILCGDLVAKNYKKAVFKAWKKQQKKIDMLENKLNLSEQDIYCLHSCLDDYDIPREDEGGVFSMWGRMLIFKKMDVELKGRDK